MSAILTWDTLGGVPGGAVGFGGRMSMGFDVVISETPTKTSVATEKPVETGANVSDHVRSQLDSLALEVFVANSPIDPISKIDGMRVGDTYFTTLEIPRYVPPLNSLSGLFAAGIKALFGSTTPDTPMAQVLQFAIPFSATARTWDLLDALRSGAVLLGVTSRDWSLENMIITSLSAPRTSAEGDGAKFTIEFKQIRIVETRTTFAPVPAEKRGSGIVSAGAKGGTTPTAAKSGSVLDGIRNLVLGNTSLGGLMGGGS
jgi:hypothetical protein